jgi:hypothetical protein
MPLLLPNLDDWTYDDLVKEGTEFIPSHAPEWTNHNPSDPGIMLVELFAYLAEMLIYRVNRVTEANVHAFLALLNPPYWKPRPGRTLADEVSRTMVRLRRTARAVTRQDFERLALAASEEVARAHAIAQRDLRSASGVLRAAKRPGHVSVIILPKRSAGETHTTPAPALIDEVRMKLEPGRPLTTWLHIVGPRYVNMRARVILVLLPNSRESDVRQGALKALRRYLDPFEGGPEGKGWPFGRNVHVSELYELLDRQPGVDHVARLEILDVSPPARLKRNQRGELVSVELAPDELVLFQIEDQEVMVTFPLSSFGGT